MRIRTGSVISPCSASRERVSWRMSGLAYTPPLGTVVYAQGRLATPYLLELAKRAGRALERRAGDRKVVTPCAT
jgi:hypothetical protein